MAIRDFRSPDLHYTGWLEKARVSNQLEIKKPTEGEVFVISPGANKKEITVSGSLKGGKGKVLVIVRTDRDYPQALVTPKRDGKWSISGCSLGGVDHQIYAVLVDKDDKPIFRSKVVNVRLERKV